ncbi:multidrug and toxin extrusion protein 1-like [Lampris incognitus]|uniref:multidrug and toxin extrusion protein 1-like n=1 Tax=Lampris incognitus TaxID=2546036 RepID=UPI0024B4FB37|nr:multidrug and toxin extrusion protein 1-like [Lampris incognitus]
MEPGAGPCTEATVPNALHDDCKQKYSQLSTECDNLHVDISKLKVENEQLKATLRNTQFSFSSIKCKAAQVLFFTGCASKGDSTNGVNNISKTDGASAAGVTEETQACCGPRPRVSQHWIPVDYRREVVQLFRLAGPVIISQLMVFLISFISTVFCGHLGKTELAGVALAIAVINVTGISIGTGMASACDTLISQTYGSGNLKRVGVILQRGILILLLACFPCWALLINTEPILLAVRQSPEVASLSQLYVKIFMPALPAAFMYQLQGRYLQNQGIIWPQVITGAMGNVVNALINYIFLYPLDLGVAGSAAANALSQYSLCVFLYVYICWKGLHKATWGGWSLDCLQEWGPFIQLAIPSMLMLCLEWWMFEVGGFLAGVISEVELGAQSIVYELATTAYMFPLGFSVAASVRVGNALGAGDTEKAKLSGKVAIICTFIVSCFVGASVGIPKDVIGYIFTSEQEIIQRVADVMIMYSFFHLLDATAGVTGGIVRGAGKQMIGALCNLVGYYFIGFPIGVSLMFAAKMGIVGLWSGLMICVALQSTFFIVFVWKLNWKKATEEALVRAGVGIREEKEMTGMENKEPSLDLDQNQAQDRTPPSGCVSSEEGSSGLEVLGSGQRESAKVLSVRQLVLRRGLAVLIMVLILVAGIFISWLLIRLLQ